MPRKETWKVNPQYGKENVYWLWDADSNYHKDTSPEAMDRRATLMQAAPEMLEACRNILTGIDQLIRSYTITHVVRGQCKGQKPVNADEYSAASEAEHQYSQAREAVRAAIAKAEGKARP